MNRDAAPPQTIAVVAAVLKDAAGRVLITQRPPGKPMAGYWEFPGGKIESCELPRAALVRELKEELGIDVQKVRPLLQHCHDYPDRRVMLDVWRVTRHNGMPHPREGQAFAWIRPDELAEWQLLPADAPIIAALRLPPLMLVTPAAERDAEAFLKTLERRLARGVEFVQFRAPALAAKQYSELARDVIEICRTAGARVVLNAEPELAEKLGADGVHLNAARLRRCTDRPLPRSLLVGASCHDAAEMAATERCRPDYIVAGAVLQTVSHPGGRVLGWEGFSRLAASTAVPVYAIGGLGPQHLESTRRHGGYGVAAMRALWTKNQGSDSS